jgi:hypothetical protein
MPLAPPNPNSRYHQGYYQPRNARKFINPGNLVYRSGLELRLFQYFDRHPDIIKVSSEEIKIPYLHPVTRKFHMYHPDFMIKTRKGDTILIEVKPSAQCKPPVVKKGKKPTKRLINEAQTWSINEAKWLAAKKWCDDRGIEFKILTEKEIG